MGILDVGTTLGFDAGREGIADMAWLSSNNDLFW
jgi:hypothetical protein